MTTMLETRLAAAQAERTLEAEVTKLNHKLRETVQELEDWKAYARGLLGRLEDERARTRTNTWPGSASMLGLRADRDSLRAQCEAYEDEGLLSRVSQPADITLSLYANYVRTCRS